MFGDVDVLAMPTIPMTAPRWRAPRDHEDALELTMLGGTRSLDLGPVIANTCPFNYTGHPAISVPCAKLDGMPVGLMLVAPYFRDDLLLQAAAAYQQSVDWTSLISTLARDKGPSAEVRRPRQPAQRTESTPRRLPSGAASQLDPSLRSRCSRPRCRVRGLGIRG